MGDAKRRGTFEERRALAIVRDEEQEARAEAAREAAWNAMSPQDRQNKMKARMLMATLPGLLGVKI